jgi:hypothetical protein
LRSLRSPVQKSVFDPDLNKDKPKTAVTPGEVSKV